MDMKCICKSRLKRDAAPKEAAKRQKVYTTVAESFEVGSDEDDENAQHLECLEVENDTTQSLSPHEIKEMVLKSDRFQNFKRNLKYKAYHEYNYHLAANMGECMLRIPEQQHRLSPRDLNIHFHGKRGNSGKTELANTIIDVVAGATMWEDFFVLRIANSSFGTSSMRDTQVYKILSFNDISCKTLSGSLTKSLLEWDFSPVEVKFGQVYCYCVSSSTFQYH